MSAPAQHVRILTRALLLLGIACLLSVSARAGQPPNVVVILIDDQHPMHLGVAGTPTIRTPNIDALAARGVYLSNHYVVTGLCSPSRAALLTGRTPRSNGVVRNGIILDPAEDTLADLLGRAGYRTALIGKSHLGRRHEPLLYDHGFQHRLMLYPDDASTDDWFDYELSRAGVVEHHTEYITDYLTDEAIRFLNRAAGDDRPFLLWLAHPAVHAPINPPPGPPRHEQADMPWPPLSIVDDLRDKPPQQRESIYHWRFLEQGEGLIRRNSLRAWDALSSVDDNVGRLLETLDDLGVRDDTIVVYLSDHGYFFGEHQLVGKGQFFYDEQMKSPLIVSWPHRLAEGLHSEALVSSIDVMPTLLDLAGLPVPEPVEGRSFRGVLEGRTTRHRRSVLMEYFALSGLNHLPREWREAYAFPMRGVVVELDGRLYKWVHYQAFPGGPGDGLDYEFYDMAADPEELRNLMRREGPEDNALARLLEDRTYGDAVVLARSEMAWWMTYTEHPRRVRLRYDGHEGIAVEPVAPDVALVAWETDVPTAGEVLYRLAGSRDTPMRRVQSNGSKYSHVHGLFGLTPGASYELRAVSVTPDGRGGVVETVFTTPDGQAQSSR